MTKRKEIPTIPSSIHTFSITGSIRSKYTTQKILEAMRHAVQEGEYKWCGQNRIVKCGGGLMLTLAISKNDDTYILINDINLARLAGSDSYLALTDLSTNGLAEQSHALEQELTYLGISLKDDNILFYLRRLDLTQDFYVKSDPSLIIRNLRFAGETGLYRGIHPNHFIAHNEKHSARWTSRWYNISVYDKCAEIKKRDQKYHNVPDSDLLVSRNRVRYEVSLNRLFLKKFEHMMRIQKEFDHFGISDGIKLYLETLAPYIPTILRSIASDLFGEHSWYRISAAQEEVDFACRVGLIDEKSCRITIEYLRSLNTPDGKDIFQLTDTKESIIREVLDQLEINRVIIPDRILTKRELQRFPCTVLSQYVTEPGKNLDLMGLPKRSWEKSQQISHPHNKHTGSY